MLPDLQAGRLRARRQHQDPRHRPGGGHHPRRPAAHLRHGIFASPRTFPAYVRFSGPGPDLPEDIKDVGFGSMTIKLMDVPGPKLMDDEKHTQDLLCVSPRLRHPEHSRERQAAALELPGSADLLFLELPRPARARFLDAGPVERDHVQSIGHAILELRALSIGRRSGDDVSVPAQVGGHHPHSGCAVRPRAAQLSQGQHGGDSGPPGCRVRSSRCRCRPTHSGCRSRTPPCAGRKNCRRSSRPPRSASPAEFDTPAHVALAETPVAQPLALPARAPSLGNQSRARRRMYLELSQLRQERNGTPHAEPTGSELLP